VQSCSNVHPARAAALGVQPGDLNKAVRHHRRSPSVHENSDGGVHQNVVPSVLLHHRKPLQGCWQILKFEFVKQGLRIHMMDKRGSDDVTYAHAREKNEPFHTACRTNRHGNKPRAH
jgi:hypothetical protein